MKGESFVARLKRSWGAYILCTPTLILFSVFMIYPVFYVIRLSFYQWDGVTQMKFVGLENYVRLLHDPIYMVEGPQEHGDICPLQALHRAELSFRHGDRPQQQA